MFKLFSILHIFVYLKQVLRQYFKEMVFKTLNYFEMQSRIHYLHSFVDEFSCPQQFNLFNSFILQKKHSSKKQIAHFNIERLQKVPCCVTEKHLI